MRRALVTLPDGVWKVVDSLKGTLGDGDSEVIRNIVIAHLTEKGYLLKPKSGKSDTDSIAGQLDMQDAMIESLAEVLEEKGALSVGEWERRIKRKLQRETKAAP